ncbi:MAG: cobalamin-binding protein [Proteobacteria bacterium]|nr:cobalamin-binding protein [Pseudomonadota bacterium]
MDDEPRIVSLIPSGTEIVAALGLADRLVGRSHECDFPPGVERLPACTRPAFDTGGASRDIDDRVRALLREALTIYDLDTDALERLRPTHIVTQDQCAVCAVDLAEVERAVAEIAGCEARVISHQPAVLADVFDDVERTGAALGVDGAPVADALRGRIDAIESRSRGLPRKRVACIEWCEPLMVAGNWVPEMVRLAGGEDTLGVAGEHAPTIAWETLAAADADAIVFMPCGYGLGRTREDAEMLAARPAWRGLRAARTGEVYVTDGNQFFNRPGPRLVESIEILAEILHPESFSFGHQGTAWERLRAGT